jgi:hypothetical protein
VIAIANLIDQQASWTRIVRHDEVEVAIVVEVAKR